MNNIVKKIIRCSVCNLEDYTMILKLKDTPLEDKFVDKKNLHIEQEIYQLALNLCNNCGYVFLTHQVFPENEYDDFEYKSNTTIGLADHFDKYAKSIIERYNTPIGSLVVDLGSNDGSMLRSFKNNSMRVLGVEPARISALEANNNGIETINDYLTDTSAASILNKCGAAEIVTANYMYANIGDLLKFTKLVRSIMSDNAIFVVETGYHPEQYKVKMFDYIYHEHFSYFTVDTLSYLFDSCGLEMIDAEITSPKGGSVRVVVQQKCGNKKINPSVKDIINNEIKGKVNTYKFFDNFFSSLQIIKNNLHKLLKDITLDGKKVIGFGASHSTTTLIYHFELSDYIDYIVDDNEAKHGLYSPGLHIPVFSTNRIYVDKPNYVLLLAWQHSSVILERHSKFLSNGRRVIVPLPSVRVLG